MSSLQLPYLHFETFESFRTMSNALATARARANSCPSGRAYVYSGKGEDHVSEEPAQNLFQATWGPSLSSVTPGRLEEHTARVMSPSSIAEYSGADISRAWSTGKIPSLHHHRRHWDAASFKTFPPSRLRSHETAESREGKNPAPSPKASTPAPASEVDKTLAKKTNTVVNTNLHHDLLIGYMGGEQVDDRGFQPRRTLDEYKYSHLGSIGERDADQVIYRYTKAKNQELKIFMVDQLWTWILDDSESSEWPMAHTHPWIDAQLILSARYTGYVRAATMGRRR